MKLLITSIDAIIDAKTGEYFDGIKGALDYFESLEKDSKVVVISLHKSKLDAIPDDFQKIPVPNRYRKSADLIEILKRKNGIEYNEIYVLGAKDDDMILAANAKMLLLTADYAKSNNSTDRIYTVGYGIGIFSPDRLKFFFEHFTSLHKPWYYKLDIDKQTTLYGLTNAETIKETDKDVQVIGDRLREFLKSGITEFKNPFLIYAVMSVFQIYNEVSEINYWGYYPSSTGAENTALKTFKEILRKFFKSSKSDEDILIRHTPSKARKTMSPMARVLNGCNSEFDTIHLNPYYANKLKGSNVLIIDDFTNHGSSCESVRHLLQKAGVNKIIFLSLGKFRTDYKIFDYKLEGNVYAAGYGYKRIGNFTPITGKVNRYYAAELVDSLKGVVK